MMRITSSTEEPPPPSLEWRRTQPNERWRVLPYFERESFRHGDAKITYTLAYVPIWLLAVVCLAWPVTSFLVRRRRRGRGFEVETKAAGDSAADPPDAAGGRG